MRAFFLTLFVLLHGAAAQLSSPTPSQCPVLDCCGEECCFNGTSYSGTDCIPDSNSSGWNGMYQYTNYESGCAYHVCCEDDCCAEGTVWDSSTSYCIPNVTVPLFPLKCGSVVVTCRSSQAGRFVLGVIDVSDPVCNAPAPFVGGPENWFAPMYHNEDGVAWTLGNLGSEVFGLALDRESPAPNIYVLPAIIYRRNPDGTFNPAPQEVWKISGTTGAKTVLATLSTGNSASNPFANKGAGLGQIAYNRAVKNLYVTSFADGWIYRLDTTGTVLSTFDPLLGGMGSLYSATSDTIDLIGLDDRIWGVQVNHRERRLYYGTWSNYDFDLGQSGNRGVANGVWSVALDASGNFMPATEQLEVDFALFPTAGSVGNPISDIAFSNDDRAMLVSERTLGGAHDSGVYRFNGSHSTGWTLNAVPYEIGRFLRRTNSAGGVDFSDCVADDSCNNGDLVMATADAIQIGHPTYGDIYGLQILPAAGGGPDDSYAVDFDASVRGQDKTANGDVEVVKCGCPITGVVLEDVNQPSDGSTMLPPSVVVAVSQDPPSPSPATIGGVVLEDTDNSNIPNVVIDEVTGETSIVAPGDGTIR